MNKMIGSQCTANAAALQSENLDIKNAMGRLGSLIEEKAKDYQAQADANV